MLTLRIHCEPLNSGSLKMQVHYGIYIVLLIQGISRLSGYGNMLFKDFSLNCHLTNRVLFHFIKESMNNRNLLKGNLNLEEVLNLFLAKINIYQISKFINAFPGSFQTGSFVFHRFPVDDLHHMMK